MPEPVRLMKHSRSARVAAVVAALTMLGPMQVASADEVAPDPPAPGPATVAMATTIRVVGRGDARACRGVAGACTLERAAGARIELRVEPTGALAGRTVRLERSWRRPGTSRLTARQSLRRVLGGERLAMQLPLSLAATQPGLWCVRALVDADPSTAAPAASATPTCVRLRPPIEIGWAGDTVVGSHYGLPPLGGRLQLAGVHHLLQRPDLMIGNYEGTLSRGGSPRCTGAPPCFIFQAPPERARNLALAGFDVMNLANNHGLDMGLGARSQTVAALDRVGIDASGLPGQVTVEQVADTRVAIVGFSPYPGTTSMRSTSAVRELVQRAARRGDMVVAAFHAGLEGARGAHVPRGADAGTYTRAAAHAAVDAGADVVFGSGPHVVRGVERYRGAFIVYSSGNFAGWHNFALGGLASQSGVVRVTFDHTGQATDAWWDGVVIDQPGSPRPDRSGRVVRHVASLSRADFGSRAARFARSGRFH